MFFSKLTKQPKYQLKNQSIILFLTICLVIGLLNSNNLQADTTSASNKNFELAQQARAILTKNCLQCHGMNGVATKNIFVLDHTRLIKNKTIIAGDANSLLLKMVETNAMPIGKSPLSEKDKAILRTWVLAGAPSWDKEQEKPTDNIKNKKFIAESALLATIEKDLEQASERSRPYLRYFSITHLSNASISEEELEQYRVGLTKLINSLSWHKEITIPTPINAEKTLLRIDLRDFNWTADTWRTILSSYPYAVKLPANEVIKSFSGAEIPYIRADWFMANASVAPLYHNILCLPNTITELEKLLGVDVNRNLQEERNIIRAGLRSSGVSQNNRIVERHVSNYGAYWKSYDFSSSLDSQNIFSSPLTMTSAGGEMIFNLPNGMQAYFLVDSHGKRLDVAPVAIVSDRSSPESPIIHNGRSCMSCHFAGMKYFRDDMRSTLEAELTSASRNTSRYFTLEKALAIYPTQNTLDNLLEQDQDRFRQAIEKTGSKLSPNLQSEPINALARRFEAELSLPLAAAEAGLDKEEFLARVRASSRLSSLGYSQLVVANGAFKRDAWEKYYSDLVQELHLGEYLSSQILAKNLRQNNQAVTKSNLNTLPTTNVVALNSSTKLNAQGPLTSSYGNANDNSPAALLRASQTIGIHTKTRFFNIDFLQTALLNDKEFQSQGLAISDNWSNLDLIITVDRPVFTFDYTFNLKHAKKGIILASGKIIAGDARAAAPKIAKELIKQIQNLRKAGDQ
ncbi:MAG: hypothetical protein JNM06_12140 [Blastocatellia bacterium]|nr:hypothetical protein [Blastocatellia bacterium]